MVGGITVAIALSSVYLQRYDAWVGRQIGRFERRMAENSRIAVIGRYPNGEPIYLGVPIPAAATVQEEAIIFGHGARHLAGTDLSEAVVESAIRNEIRDVAQGASVTGSFWGSVTVNGRVIEYRAFTLSNGTINVGTYYIKR